MLRSGVRTESLLEGLHLFVQIRGARERPQQRLTCKEVSGRLSLSYSNLLVTPRLALLEDVLFQQRFRHLLQDTDFLKRMINDKKNHVSRKETTNS